MFDASVKFFSIIITTRNRPKLFVNALESALEQDFSDKEIIVVIDGCDEEYKDDYEEIIKQYRGLVTFSKLVHRRNGHGHSYAINHGASISNSKYLCFIDDDDLWTDNGYLSRVYMNIQKKEYDVDLYLSNQNAYFSNGKKLNDTVWIEDLIEKNGYSENFDRVAYETTVPKLLESDGFAHLNCLVISACHFENIDGLDESLRYEDDRDFYYRAIDNSENLILYDPIYMSRHNIPVATKKENLSTSNTLIDKLIYQLRVYDKSILCSNNQSLRRLSLHAKSNLLKIISEKTYEQGKVNLSCYYAWQALAMRFTTKWLLYSIYISVKSSILRRYN